jgi:hypothetical protein
LFLTEKRAATLLSTRQGLTRGLHFDLSADKNNFFDEAE